MKQSVLTFAPTWAFAVAAACGPCDGKSGDSLRECALAETEDPQNEHAEPSSVADQVETEDSNQDTEQDDNQPSDCQDVGLLTESTTLKGWIQYQVAGNDDKDDYYCFELVEVTTVRATLTGNDALDLYEFDDGLTSAPLGSGKGGTTAWDLLPGHYAINVHIVGFQSGNYELTLAPTALGLKPAEPEPGASSDTAFALEPEADLTWVDGYVGSQKGDSTDLFDVQVPEATALAIQLEHVGASGAIGLAWTPFEAVPIFTKDALGPISSGASQPLADRIPEGRFLVRVSGNGPYRLGFALSPVDEDAGVE